MTTKYHACNNMKSFSRFTYCKSGSSVICSIEEFKSLPDEQRCKRCERKLKKIREW